MGWIKINTNETCRHEAGTIGLGCVIRDDKGDFVRARSNLVQANYQPRVAEALSLKKALAWTKNWRTSKCIFVADAKLLVDAVNTVNGNQGNSIFHTIVDDCKEILKHFEDVLVVFIHRSANSVAHLIAKGAYSMSGFQEWYHAAPDFYYL